MFIREIEHPDIPFYTLELKDKKVIQVRGNKNKDPEQNIKDFVSKWAKIFDFKYLGEQARFNFY